MTGRYGRRMFRPRRGCTGTIVHIDASRPRPCFLSQYGDGTSESTDVLRDAAGLRGDDLALPQTVQQRRLTVIHMTHNGDHRGAPHQAGWVGWRSEGTRGQRSVRQTRQIQNIEAPQINNIIYNRPSANWHPVRDPTAPGSGPIHRNDCNL